MPVRARFSPTLLFACLAFGVGTTFNTALASDPHAPPADHGAKPAKPDAHATAKHEGKVEPKAAPKANPDPDGLDAVRAKLAARLNPKPDAAPNTLRVSGHGAATPESAHGAPRQRQPRHVSVAKAEASAANAHGAMHRGESHIHWSYAGEGGPDNWGNLRPEFNKCASGTRQSPIDIREGIRVQLEPIQFDYSPSGFAVVDNGHTIQVQVSPGNGITVMGRRYDLLQFHFHRPSEERINGRQFDMVAHLVHKDPEGRLAVVAVLLDRGAAQPLIQAVWNNLPLEKFEPMAAQTAIDLKQLLPDDRSYYTYMGSLTTPPCSEGVLWMVMRTPVPMSPQQIGIFSKLYPMNARPVQSAQGRLIKEGAQ